MHRSTLGFLNMIRRLSFEVSFLRHGSAMADDGKANFPIKWVQGVNICLVTAVWTHPRCYSNTTLGLFIIHPSVMISQWRFAWKSWRKFGDAFLYECLYFKKLVFMLWTPFTSNILYHRLIKANDSRRSHVLPIRVRTEHWNPGCNGLKVLVIARRCNGKILKKILYRLD